MQNLNTTHQEDIKTRGELFMLAGNDWLKMGMMNLIAKRLKPWLHELSPPTRADINFH